MKVTPHMKHWRIPIKLVSVAGLGLLVAIALGSVLYLGFSVASKNTNQLLSEKIEATLNAIAARVDKHLQPVERQAVQIARAFESGELTLDDPEKLQSFFSGFFSAASQVSAVGLLKPNRRMSAITRQTMTLNDGPWPGREPLSALFEDIAEDRKSRWKPPIWSVRLQQSIATYYTPITAQGQFVAVLVQTVPIAELSRFMSEETYLDGVPFIYYADYKLIAHPKLISWSPATAPQGNTSINISEIGETLLEDLLATPGNKPRILSNLKNTAGKHVERDNRDYLIFTRSITRYGEEPWTLGLYIDARAEGDTVQRLFQTLLVAVGFLILTVGVAIYAGILFSRPIRSLAGSMELVRQNKITEVKDLPPSNILEFDEAAQSFNKMIVGLRERDLIRQTLGRYVPAEVAESLLKKNGVLPTEEAIATVLFADIEGFTYLTENLGPEGIVALLNAYFSDMVEIIERHGGVVTQFQGDAILATFNIPIAHAMHARNALVAALEMRDHSDKRRYHGHAVRARIGVNSGRLISGAVGAQGRLNYTVHGDAVNLAARIENMNKDFGTYILTTQATLDQTHGLLSQYVGETNVRGQSTPVKLYTLPEQVLPI
ncbi:MAG: hypothetical protein HQ483_18835 [Rhodospirillales bacterium]|nr:hypothetical protein [Rhodospirillales bacterium]